MLIIANPKEKNVQIAITISISDLEEIEKVSEHNLYSDKASWENISLEYLNPTNNQKKIIPVKYNGETSTLETSTTFSEFFEGNTALFSRIAIYDKGNGHLIINRSDIADPTLLDIIFVEE